MSVIVVLGEGQAEQVKRAIEESSIPHARKWVLLHNIDYGIEQHHKRTDNRDVSVSATEWRFAFDRDGGDWRVDMGQYGLYELNRAGADGVGLMRYLIGSHDHCHTIAALLNERAALVQEVERLRGEG